jgi:hypothetical protein
MDGVCARLGEHNKSASKAAQTKGRCVDNLLHGKVSGMITLSIWSNAVDLNGKLTSTITDLSKRHCKQT